MLEYVHIILVMVLLSVACTVRRGVDVHGFVFMLVLKVMYYGVRSLIHFIKPISYVGDWVRVANSIKRLVKRYYTVISSDFGLLWFQVGI